MISLTVNHRNCDVDASPDMPLLWILRDLLGLTGTKFGCGVAQCGACTIHQNGEAVRSCVTPLSRAAGQEVLTIEGLSANNDHPLQLAWAELDVPQCAYCQSGQLMSAAELLRPPTRQTRTSTTLCREIYAAAGRTRVSGRPFIKPLTHKDKEVPMDKRFKNRLPTPGDQERKGPSQGDKLLPPLSHADSPGSSRPGLTRELTCLKNNHHGTIR